MTSRIKQGHVICHQLFCLLLGTGRPRILFYFLYFNHFISHIIYRYIRHSFYFLLTPNLYNSHSKRWKLTVQPLWSNSFTKNFRLDFFRFSLNTPRDLLLQQSVFLVEHSSHLPLLPVTPTSTQSLSSPGACAKSLHTLPCTPRPKNIRLQSWTQK